MVWRRLGLWMLVGLLVVAGVAVAEEEHEDVTWFGLVGSTLGVVLADFEALNDGLADRGFPMLPEVIVVTGGRGRVGAVDGVSFGGIGWSGGTASIAGARFTSYEVGFGGLEAGWAIGGGETSLLTIGAVLGGGGSTLALSEDLALGGGGGSVSPCGVVPGPTLLERSSAFGVIEPFISLQAQPTRHIGFELHVGYLVSLFDVSWGSDDLGGLLPRLVGPSVGLSLTWGAIGNLGFGIELGRLEHEETIDQTVLLSGPCVEIDHALGRVEIETIEAAETVHLVAVKRAGRASVLDRISVLIEPTRCGLKIRSEGPEYARWEIDYMLVVPAGSEVDVELGAGGVRLAGTLGESSIEIGVGETTIEELTAPTLAIDAGLGDITVIRGEIGSAHIGLGAGDIEVMLSDDASVTVSAEVGVGDVIVGPFAGVEWTKNSGIGVVRQSVTLGDGAGNVELHVGIGSIHVKPDFE